MFERLKNVFSIDLRSLAIVRIFVALIILFDLASRFPGIAVWYGDQSVLPTSLLSTFWAGDWAWSLHLLGGGVWAWIAFLFLVQAIFATFLLLGYQTRVSTIATWILIVSLHNANPLILQGGDFLLRAILFVCMFLPWGAVFSIDAARKGEPTSMNMLSGWSMAYLLQMGLFYVFASIFKSAPEWTSAGSAVYYTLSIDQYATSLAKWMLHFPVFLQFLTFAIWYFQHTVLFLLFSPVLLRYFRPLAALALAGMHLSFALMMHLGMFSWITIAALIGFIPPDTWDALLQKVEQHVRSTFNYLASFFPHVRSKPKKLTNRHIVFASISSLVGVVYILYMFVWQAQNVVAIQGYLPRGWDTPAKILRIDQRWNLFAPYPYRDDGWFVIPGTLANGDKIDLYKNGAPLSYETPENYFALYPSTRWRKYGIEIRHALNERYRPYYASYLCNAWNASHKGDSRLTSLEIIYMLDMVPPPGEASPPIEKLVFLEWRCE